MNQNFTGDAQLSGANQFAYGSPPLYDATAFSSMTPNAGLPSHHPFQIVGHNTRDTQRWGADNHPLNAGSQLSSDTQTPYAPGTLPDGKIQCFFDTPHDHDVSISTFDGIGQCTFYTHKLDAESVTPCLRDEAIIAALRQLYKQRNDIIRARGNLTRQIISICRHSVGFNTFLPEKERKIAEKAGDKLLADLKAGNPEAIIVQDSAGFLLNMLESSGFEKQKSFIEKKMASAAKLLGMMEFIDSVKGFSTTQLASIVGEAGDLANYATVSKLWKRLGLAVINGERQRKQSDPLKAMEHGYNPSRRSSIWNIGETILKASIRSVKDENGERTGESIAIAPLGQIYLDRKKYLAETHPTMTKSHIHNSAKRYIEKRLIRDLWKAWNTKTQ